MSQSMQIDPVADLLNGLAVFRAATLRQLAELGEASGDDVIGELCGLLLADAPVRLAAMRSGLSSGDTRSTEHAAHSLKSSCAMLGGERTARLCQEIESRSRRGAVAELAPFVETLALEIPRFLAALNEFAEARRVPG
ncbi:MAG: Hpt domain-containing protein [Polyangia bacterium]